ncbi:MAG: hypothetical protein E7562_04440 [Ruminococcaceae bacterium]|nr:hypothetical protein [Oscillospiraceae bacterium]
MKNSTKTILLSLLVMALWGSLFPMVKLGYKAFEISSKSVPDILMFASYRFIISGLVVSAFCLIKKEKIATPKAKSILNIVIMGLFSIVLHYACTYIGLSTTDSSKTALIKQLGALIYVCFAFLFFKNEKFSILKIVGAIIGFGGIVAINYNPNGIIFAIGDILIIGASVCTVVANVISKKSVQGSSPYWITGISQFFGGIVLFVAAVIMGGKFLEFNLTAALIFTYICIASICSYTLWYYVLKNNSLSKMFIIKFAEPLFACVFGALILGENIFKWQYFIAFLLISFGIVLGNKSDKIKADKDS